MKTYLFWSSRPSVTVPYKTILHDDGRISCDCPARVECWHKKKVRAGNFVGCTEAPQVSQADQRAIRRLVDEGLQRGACFYTLELFPSMSEEETMALVDQITSLEEPEYE